MKHPVPKGQPELTPLTVKALEDFVVDTMGITRVDIRHFGYDGGKLYVREQNWRQHPVDVVAFEAWAAKR